ncbi:CoA ester lyase [Rhodococcus sp. IEGM 1307]|uniref:HpcH/HpaI aldolase/citrate lyase family protein n=1 Tax=Rhodococcus sp. IEGM 1307 TaxID=3047091 RepID=UPI0024B67D57|nr:CoA ester lyase [Rhodococcus sp. IEGM 1307]MDI9977253.1 CoA ester lyase [Rhodococcus sp. IEGM 1307]
MPTSRLRRSELSTPGHSPKMIAKAAASDADLVFLDLEDSVVAAKKIESRQNIIEGLTTLDWGSKTRAVRINPVSTPWCHGDIVDIVTAAGNNLDVIIIPKVFGPRDVWFVEDLLTQLETHLGLEVGRIKLEVLIEETEALSRVEEIAACSPRLEALILGVGDLSASQGIRLGHIGAAAEGVYGYPGDVWHYARNRMIGAARAHGLDAVDGPYGAISNPDGYEREATWAATLGSVGKWAIHPSQIAIANQVFAPTPTEIKRATAAVRAVEEAEQAGLGAAAFEGMMIDAATTRIFVAVLERARQCGVA